MRTLKGQYYVSLFQNTMNTKSPFMQSSAIEQLDKFLEGVVDAGRAPAIFAGITTADREMYFATSGPRFHGHPEKGSVDEHTTLQLFSSSKLVTTIACLQQVDRGMLSLDDADLVSRVIPEIYKQGVLLGYKEDEATIDAVHGGITLRQLLTHTSGTTYWHSAADHHRWAMEHEVAMSLGADISVKDFATPLAFQPNTRWEYSFGMDWAGILLSRLLDQSLEDIFQQYIFQPCGMASTTFYPTPKIKDRLMGMCGVDASGSLVLGSGSLLELGRCMDHTSLGATLSGGGGLYGTARDYLRMLRGILASQHSGHPNAIISTASFKELFTNCVPLTAQIQKDMARGAAQQNVHPPRLLVNDGEFIAHSVGLMMYGIDSEFGRKAGSAFWDGAAKTYYWLDPVTGIAGVCFTNILAETAIPYNKVYNEFERVVYDNLA